MKKETAHGSPMSHDDGDDKDVQSSRNNGSGASVDGVLQETDSPNKEASAEKKEDTRKMRARRSQSNVCYVSYHARYLRRLVYLPVCLDFCNLVGLSRQCLLFVELFVAMVFCR